MGALYISPTPTENAAFNPLLLLRDVIAHVLTQSLHTNGCTRHVS
jgi:hypothetical protein